jgi:hypothetical protein
VKPIRTTLNAIAHELLGSGEYYMRSFQQSRRKDGGLVFRMTGWGWDGGINLADDGNIYITHAYSGIKKEPVMVTADNLEEILKKYHFGRWEWNLLTRGTDRVAKEFAAKLREHGITATVSIGEATAYPTTIVVRMQPTPIDQSRPVIESLMARLPVAGTLWPSEDRQRFIAAFLAMLDLLYPPEPQ